jgi:hypothetical protein
MARATSDRRVAIWPARAAAALIGLLAAASTGCQLPSVVRFTMQPWTYAGAPGYQLQTDHYDIYTTVKDKELVAMFPTVVETAFTYYTTLVPPSRTPPARMPMYLFATRGEWLDFTQRTFSPERAKRLALVRGGYSEQGVAVIQYQSNAVTFVLLPHEGFHQYMYHYVTERIPAWINEGLAVCCEGQRWDGPRVTFDPWANPKRRNVLAERARDRLIPLAQLLRIDAGEALAGPASMIDTYYAQVWALVMFLREGEGGKYAASWQRLLTKLDDPNLERSAMAASISDTSSEYDFGTGVLRAFIARDLGALEVEYVQFCREDVVLHR